MESEFWIFDVVSSESEMRSKSMSDCLVVSLLTVEPNSNKMNCDLTNEISL